MREPQGMDHSTGRNEGGACAGEGSLYLGVPLNPSNECKEPYFKGF